MKASCEYLLGIKEYDFQRNSTNELTELNSTQITNIRPISCRISDLNKILDDNERKLKEHNETFLFDDNLMLKEDLKYYSPAKKPKT